MIELKDTVAGMDSFDYKKHLRSEFQQTYIRWKKLSDMIEKHKAGTLGFTPTCPIELLEEQRNQMRWLLETLMHRAMIEEINVMEGLF